MNNKDTVPLLLAIHEGKFLGKGHCSLMVHNLYINDDPGLTLKYSHQCQIWSLIHLYAENCFKVI